MSDKLALLSRMDQIQVLLAEYNTLRAELMQRHSAAFQISGAFAAAWVASLAY